MSEKAAGEVEEERAAKKVRQQLHVHRIPTVPSWIPHHQSEAGIPESSLSTTDDPQDHPRFRVLATHAHSKAYIAWCAQECYQWPNVQQ